MNVVWRKRKQAKTCHYVVVKLGEIKRRQQVNVFNESVYD